MAEEKRYSDELYGKYAAEYEILYQKLKDRGFNIYDGRLSQEELSDYLRRSVDNLTESMKLPENFVGLCADMAANRVILRGRYGQD